MINTYDERLPTVLQIEITELQGSSVYQNGYMESSFAEFYSSLGLAKYRKLGYSALQVLYVFGNMYICKQTFFHDEHKLKNIYIF